MQYYCLINEESLNDFHYFLVFEVNEENLEDLLTFDDLFLDFFNAFLALPVSIGEILSILFN